MMTNRWMVCVVGSLLATALIACGDSTDAEDGQRQDVGETVQDVGGGEDTENPSDDDAGDVGGGEDTGDPSDEDTGETEWPTEGLNGVWAQQTVMSSLSKVPVVGDVTTKTITIQKVVIGGTAPDYTVQSTPCSVEMESSSTVVKTIVPDAFVRSLPTTERSMRVDGSRFEMPPLWEARGVNLSAVETEALPTDKNDARIFDQDGDGKPGMTVRISGIISGDIYVIQRGSTELAGTVAENRLDGLVVWTDEQVILGSDNAILESNQPENRIDPNAENSFFHTTRLGEELDCEAIVAQAETLFAR